MKGVIDHFSYSQLNTYLMCPLRYRLQYVELIPPAFNTSALVFGSAVHEAVAAFHQQRLVGDTLRPDQMLDVYRQAWVSRNGEEIRVQRQRKWESRWDIVSRELGTLRFDR